jgi:hypothetical protein
MSTSAMRCFAGLTALLCALGCQPGPLIHNTSVDLWCGDRPCHWEVEGRIERIGTWHERDYAVEFVSDDARLSQWNEQANAEYADCYDFAMVAKVDRGVKLYLELDFLDDGVIDWSQPVPESDWQRRTFLITAPSWYEGVRFILRKDGPGYAALAQLSAEVSYDCNRQPIELLNRPPGALCEHDDECAAGSCNGGRCAACAQNADCDESGVCGVRHVDGSLRQECVAHAGSAFGERCLDGAQCETGVCCEGVCSTCCDDEPCEDGLTCGPAVHYAATDSYGEQPFVPWHCGAGERRGAPGDLCTHGDDCASELCVDGYHMCAGMCAHDGCYFCELKLIGGACE